MEFVSVFLEYIHTFQKKFMQVVLKYFFSITNTIEKVERILVKVTSSFCFRSYFTEPSHKMLYQGKMKYFVYFEDLFPCWIFAIYELTPLTLSQTSPGFYVSAEEVSHNEQFLLFPHFLPLWRTFCNIYQIQNCCLQSLSI